MDADRATLESTDSKTSLQSKSTSLLHPEPPLTLSSRHQRRLYRQSVRLPPSQILEIQHAAAPPSPVIPDASEGQPHSPDPDDMSLFTLFSKPKVERAHGYAEPGLAPPPTSLFTKHANGSRPELIVRVDPKNADLDAPSRAPSSMSFFNPGARPSTRLRAQDAAQVVPQPRRGVFEPPPLFQAYPQSKKHNALEVSSMTAETVLQKSKARKMGSSTPLSLEVPQKEGVDDRSSMDTRRRTAMRHVAQGSVTHVDMPKKIIVLVASGYLLQYAESGPSDRLPEKILQLGKDSAAFACDLIPGKHYVLQVTATADQQGVVVANSKSIFSKLGLRNSATKQMAKNLLLIMPGAAEMNSWMMAIRQEIEVLGGIAPKSDVVQGSRADSTVSNDNRTRQASSQSPRFLERTDQRIASQPTTPPIDAKSSIPSPALRVKDEDEKAETATLDEIEQDAAQLANDEPSPSLSQNEPDAQSLTSSRAVSVDQQRLNSLQSSHRASHATVATTIASSRTNSISEPVPTDQPNKESSETNRDSVQARSAYRTLTSYAASRRRSVLPAPREPLPNLDVLAPPRPQAETDNLAESPVIGHNAGLSTLPLTTRTIGAATSVPNLRGVAETKSKHDSKLPSTPLLLSDTARPESFVGDLPPPSTWANERSPSKRMSLLGGAATSAANQRSNSGRTTQSSKSSRRQSMQPFSLPLKVNPSTPANRPPSRHENHNSFNKLEPAGEEPTVHTLTAKIDAGKLTSVSPVQVSPVSPRPSPKPDVPGKHPARSPSGRLSLFPTPLPLPSPTAMSQTPTEAIRRSPSAAVPSNQAQSQANGYALKRPNSMQVRSDHAPFLKSVRASTIQPSPNQGRSFTAPIRSLKPSRSSTYLSAAGAQSTTPDQHNISPAVSLLPEGEAADRAMPLPDRSASPMPIRPPSRTSGRKMKTRSSLPELDLNTLGPPAPPPSAPLPAPPTSASRPVSPLPTPAGLGIKV